MVAPLASRIGGCVLDRDAHPPWLCQYARLLARSDFSKADRYSKELPHSICCGTKSKYALTRSSQNITARSFTHL